MALHTSSASDSTDPVTASLDSMHRRCQIEVKYVEAVAGSVESDAGDVWSATRELFLRVRLGALTRGYQGFSHRPLIVIY